MRYLYLLITMFCFSSCEKDKPEIPEPEQVLGVHEFDKGAVIDAALCDNGNIMVLSFGTFGRPVTGVDTKGKLWFSDQYGAERISHLLALASAPDDGFVIFGTGQPSSPVNMLHMLHVDRNGNYSWLTSGGHPTIINAARRVIRTRAGNYFGFGEYAGQSLANPTINMMWCDQQGNKFRTAVVDVSDDIQWDNVTETTDNGFVFTGTRFNSSNAFRYIVLLKVNEQGVEQWRTIIPSPSHNMTFGRSIALRDGSILSCGHEMMGVTEPTGRKALLVKTSASGVVLWSSSFTSGALSCTINDMLEKDNGDILLTGAAGDAADNTLKVSLLTVDKDGTELSRKIFPSRGHGRRLFPRSDGGYTIVGDAADVARFFVLITDKDGNTE